VNKKSSFALAVLGVIVLSSFLAGCDNSVRLKEEILLRPGQTVSVSEENLKITFDKVTADSRCPTGATCVWAGEVKCSVRITQGGKVSLINFIYPGAGNDYAKLTYKNRLYSFKVTPYPELGKPIPQDKYRLILVIE